MSCMLKERTGLDTIHYFWFKSLPKMAWIWLAITKVLLNPFGSRFDCAFQSITRRSPKYYYLFVVESEKYIISDDISINNDIFWTPFQKSYAWKPLKILFSYFNVYIF